MSQPIAPGQAQMPPPPQMVGPGAMLGGGPMPTAHDVMMGVSGATHGGAVPMMPMSGIEQNYPSLRAGSSVDWHRVNPRLLQVLDKQAQKLGSVIVLSSGYRDHAYNAGVGGHPQSNHKLGTAIDAQVNGHPIGEVIDPAALMKLGLKVGGPNDDPAHVDLVGIPVKGVVK